MDSILDLKDRYQNGVDNIGTDLISPCLNNCKHYRRGTGFFSSSALKAYAESLGRIISDDVKIDILCSPIIQDKSLIRTLEFNVTPELREKTVREISEYVLLMAVGFQQDSTRRDYRSKLLSYLIASGRLELKFAIPNDFEWPDEKENERNIYHVKLGYFKFPDGKCVAFDGSFNESDSGHSHHVDRTQVYRSWVVSDEERLEGVVEDVDRDWNESNLYISVYSLTKKTLDIIKRLSPKTRPKIPGAVLQPKPSTKQFGDIEFPKRFWPHQKKAVVEFLDKKAGILEMATGTGKTTTALEIMRQLVVGKRINTIIISTYGTDLLNQWHKEIGRWKNSCDELEIRDIVVFSEYNQRNELHAFSGYPNIKIILISRDASNLKRLLKSGELVKAETLIIHDEVHGFGSPTMVQELSGTHNEIAFRLGLSATPEREYDKEGSQFITREIGKTIFEFTLLKAIEQGILCEFEYTYREFCLTEEDRVRRRNVYSRQERARAEGTPWTQERLYIELSKVIKKAEQKPLVLSEFLTKNPETIKSSIFFVLDREQGDLVCSVINNYTHRYKTYYAGTVKEYLEMLANHRIDTLIACERLNEGIDIKGLKSVFLIASPNSKLDTIQRIGRCLRVDPSDPNKKALVFDLICKNEIDADKLNADNRRMEWLKEISQAKKIT